jgi:hypothetical protein
MIVKVSDYGEHDNGKFVEYSVFELSEMQLKFLDENLDEDTQIDDDILKVKMFFEDDLYPFQSDVAQFRLDDFIASEEIEMTFFLTSFLEDM